MESLAWELGGHLKQSPVFPNIPSYAFRFVSTSAWVWKPRRDPQRSGVVRGGQGREDM